MRITILLLLLLLLPCLSFSQSTATTGADRLGAAEQRAQMSRDSGFKGIEFRSVGPTIMSGRVTDIEVDPEDATHFYVAYASGGLWETSNNGQSFEPRFDGQAVMTIGDIAVDWENEVIWVGTGEVNSSRSSYSGVGMFRSSDNGKTWEHRGLSDSQHIGGISIDPRDPNTIVVASLGPLYTEGGQAGIFHTTDGGRTWTNTLQNDMAGAVDLVRHPERAEICYAALWQRERRAWDFKGNGKDSGIHRSLDGGKTWKSISGADSGFPQGEGVGRIGLALSVSEEGERLYAFHDNQAHREIDEMEEAKEEGLTKRDFETMSKEEFLKLREEEVSDYLKGNGFPEDLAFSTIRARIEGDTIPPSALYDYVYDANQELFDTPVIGAEVYVYDSGAGTWSKTHDGFLDGVVYSYGYYFGTVATDPQEPMSVYIAGVPILHSADGGKNWSGINGDNVHVDHHVIWVNPDRSGHIINGNDGGINISYDNGENWVKCNSPAVGQFYTVAVDDAEPYNIYGGLQDNGVWKGPSTHHESTGWHQQGKYPYELMMWGDGMQVAIDPRDGTVYTGYQFGHYTRIDSLGEEYFHPMHELGERPLRWNWQTPIHLSVHDPDVLYMGSNRLHRSMDRAENFDAISPDLTMGGKDGNVPYGTISSIHESPMVEGRLLVGSDDGRVHVRADVSAEWTDISSGLPADRWVSRVWFSTHNADRIYVALNGYRNDDMSAYAYRSDDLGKTWQDISAGLPSEPINVLKEDRTDEELLYLGTDHGFYLSVDGGGSWTTVDKGLPAAAVHDLVVQEREQELVLGTHGRSFYVADIGPLRHFSKDLRDLGIMPMDTIHNPEGLGSKSWFAENGVRSTSVEIMLMKQKPGSAQVELLSPKGVLIWRSPIDSEEVGIIRREYDLALGEKNVEAVQKEWRKALKEKEFSIDRAEDGRYYLPSGEYELRLVMDGGVAQERIIVD